MKWVDLKISYVGIKEQCADTLTKFLRGEPDQLKAREQLSLLDLTGWIVGLRVRPKVCGADDGEFRPIVCRVQLGPSLSDQGKLSVSGVKNWLH